ncbi:MAG: LysR substrate-binding domain-containing protein [Alphaproteobacteria bacterium]|nr:LysR substrate-binding domain-containing protein [Alphaproteobacteria bacterium]
MNIELRHIRAFVMVAHELHFRRAAQKMNLGQPALSRHIKWLEQEVGVKLLSRTTRSVQLTEAGRAFLAECEIALSHISQAPIVARHAAEGSIGHLSVAYNDFAISGPLPFLLQIFRGQYPGLHVDLLHLPTAQQKRAIIEGRIDIGFLIGPFLGREIESKLVSREDFVVVLPRTHPLAGQASIRLEQLSDEPFVVGSEDSWEAFRPMFLEMCASAGFVPNIVQEASTSDGILGLVAANLGVTIYPECVRTFQRENVVIVPLDGVDAQVDTLMAWSTKGEISPAVANFTRSVVAAIDEGMVQFDLGERISLAARS